MSLIDCCCHRVPASVPARLTCFVFDFSNTSKWNRNATEFHPPDSLVYREAKRLMSLFERMIEDFKGLRVSSAEKIYSRSWMASETAHLVRNKRKAEILEASTPTTGTLLVVPKPLVQHWQVSSFSI